LPRRRRPRCCSPLVRDGRRYVRTGRSEDQAGDAEQSLLQKAKCRAEVTMASDPEHPTLADLSAVITPAELAKRFQCSERRLRYMARHLGACHMFGKTMRLTIEDVSRILAAARPKPASGPPHSEDANDRAFASDLVHGIVDQRRAALGKSRGD
jgi:hypothetical protein